MYRKLLMLTLLGFAITGTACAQDIDSDIVRRYQGENAVITHEYEHMELKLEHGKLKAVSETEKEVMLLTDQAPAAYNNSYVYHSSFNKLKEINGETLIPDKNGYRKLKAKEFKTIKSTSEGVFYDDGEQTIITFQGLVKGAKTVTRYKMEHSDPHFLPAYYFQSYIPVVETVLEIEVPREVKIHWNLYGGNTEQINQTTEEKKNKTIYRWTAKNLPRLNVYDNAPDISWYMPHLIFYIESYEYQGQTHRMFGTVNDLYKFYYPFISTVNKSSGDILKKQVADIIQGASSEKEKAKKIYQWVQTNVHYVAFEDGMAGFVPRDAGTVCQRKYGDCKDMANLLVTMCREAGIKAYHTWIGTRNRPYTYEQTPLPIADNHMICVADIDGQLIYMDGTNSLIPFGIPPFNLQGKEALLSVSRDSYKIIHVPVLTPEKNVCTDSTHIGLSGASLTGSVNINIKGYGAWNIEQAMAYNNEREKEDAVKALVARGSNKFIQKAFEYKVSSDEAKGLSAYSSFEVHDYAQKVGKEWYVNMNLQRNYEDLWLDTKSRAVPLENQYKNKIREIVALDIPKGYHVSYLPPSVAEEAEGLWGFNISYKNTGKQVLLTKEFEMRTLYLQPKQFSEHNQLVEKLKKQYKESIVLTAD